MRARSGAGRASRSSTRTSARASVKESGSDPDSPQGGNNAMKFLRLLLLLPGLALAQSWPAHPITIVMGFPAGSGVDVVARMVQESMEKSLGTKLVMDYRTGAGGNLA